MVSTYVVPKMIGVSAASVSPSAGVPVGRRCRGRRALGRHADSFVVSAAMIRWLDVAVLIQRSQWPR